MEAGLVPNKPSLAKKQITLFESKHWSFHYEDPAGFCPASLWALRGHLREEEAEVPDHPSETTPRPLAGHLAASS